MGPRRSPAPRAWRSPRWHAAGLIDHIVDERPDAAAEPREFCARMGRAIEYELGRARAIPDAERLHLRRMKFARLGH